MAKLIKIGRSKENDIVIDDPSVSRFHIELFQDDEGNIFVTDLDSTNGTTINGLPLRGSDMLSMNDILKVGNVAPLPWKSYFDDKREPIIAPKINAKELGHSTIVRPRGRIRTVVISVFLLLGALFVLVYRDELFRTSSQGENLLSEVSKNEDDAKENPNSYPNKKDKPRKDIPQPTSNPIKYSYDCMENALLNDMNELESELVNMFDEEVTLMEEIEVGRQLLDGCRAQYTFIRDGRLKKLESIMKNLGYGIRNKRGFNYKIFLIETNDINAFTAGGYIFVTTGMYNFTESDDELACVIGHEMAHNECKHINHQLKKHEVNQNLFGEFFGSAADALGFFLTSGFNQKNETECDFYGIDYAVRAGYNGCEVIGLWERMSKKETQGDEIDAMMRSHPYSANRSVCCRHHIESNYGFNCPK